MPTAPSTSAGSANRALAEKALRICGDGLRSADRRRGARRGGVDPQHHVAVERGQQRVEVAVAGRGQERVDEPALAHEIGCGLGSCRARGGGPASAS